MIARGWWLPDAVRLHYNSVEHYFVEGRSLCRRYGYLGDGSHLIEDGGERRADQCKVCQRALIASEK